MASILMWAVPLPHTEAAGKPAKKATAAPLTEKSFSAGGLTHERTLSAFFRGDFESIELKREDPMFEVLFGQYLKTYALECSDHLPANKVEMTRRRCTTEEVTRNGWGVEISRICVNYVDEGTGLYAKPELYTAKKEVERLIAADTLRHVWRFLSMSQKDPFASALSMAGAAQAAANDITDLFQLNECTSPGLKRFEENLHLFALNRQPVRLEGESRPAPAEMAGPALRDEEYERLIEDLVAEQARAWAVNKYVSGSVTDVSVSARDAAGRPLRIAASYSYEGFNGPSRGSVEVHFTGGSPDCMYFFDAPATCRTPSRSIAAAFAASAQTGQAAANVASPPAPPPSPPAPAPAEPASEPMAIEPRVLSEVAPAPAPVPRRELRAVNYIQGIKDACLEVLTGGDRREPETSYCFCLSASAGSIPVSETDAQWFFENFGDEALGEMERRNPGLVRRFAVCRAQLEASR